MSTTGSSWGSFNKIGGWTAWILLIYSLVTMISMIVVGLMPATAQEGFAMLQENRIAGLLRLDLLTILFLPLYYLLFLGLYGALKTNDSANSLLAAVLGVAGVTLKLATPSAFSFLVLSDKYAAATSEAQKALFLAAGEAVLATDLWNGSGAQLGGLLMQIGMLLISIIMLRSSIFRKLTAWVGVATHGLDLLHILVAFLFPAVGSAIMFAAGPLYLVWFPLLARDFFQLGKK